MKFKNIFFAAALSLSALLIATNAQAIEAKADPAEIMKSLPDKSVQTIGIVLVNPEDKEKVVLLTQINVPSADGKQSAPKMLGLPINNDKIGKEIIEKYGIIGLKPGEKNGMERIQKASNEKAIYVNGTLKFKTGIPTLTVEKYMTAEEFMKQQQQKKSADKAK